MIFLVKRLMGAILMVGLAGPVKADEVDDLLAQAREAAAKMPDLPASASSSTQAASGRNIWVFAVGVLEFQDARYSPFSKAARRDAALAQRFATYGVPRDHIVSLLDGAATLSAVRSSLAALLSKSQPGDLLYFYYTGHAFHKADSLYLANYDAGFNDPATSWPVSSLIDDIEASFRGSEAILATEACYSGLVARHAAGARRVGYGVISSTDEHAISTAEWTFSDALLAGLDGDASYDADGDGEITFAELGRGVQDAMIYEDQAAVVATTGGFDASLKLADVKRP